MNVSTVASPTTHTSEPPGALPRASGVARELWWLCLVELVWTLGYGLFFRFAAWDLPSADVRKVFLVSALVGTGIGVVTLVLVGRLVAAVRGTPVATLARAALVLAAVELGCDLVFTGAQVVASSSVGGRLESAVGFVSLVVGLGVRASLWLVAARLLGSRVPRWLTAFVLVSLASVLVVALSWMVLPRSYLYETSSRTSVMSALSLGRFGLSTLARVATLWLFGVLAKGWAGDTSTIPPAGPRTPGRDLAVGAAWLVGGVVVSLLSYNLASEGGGRYLVATGAIVYGLARVVRGLRAA